MNMEQYLRENFPGGVKDYKEIVVDGQVRGYYVKGNNLDELYLPANTSGDVGMLSYIPGAGGSSADARMIRNRINSDNPPEYPITIAASCSDHQNCMEVGYRMAQGANMNVTNNVTVCFSASGYLGIDRTENFEDRHSDVTSTVISCEPYNTGRYTYKNEENRDGFINSNSQILFVAPTSGFHINLQEEIKKMTNSGLNAYFLGTSYQHAPSSVHIMTNADILNCGMVDYLLGYVDEFDTNPGGGNYTPNYRLIQFNPELEEYEGMDYSDLSEAVNIVRIPDLAKLKKVDAFHIESIASPVQDKYQKLSSIDQKVLSSGGAMKTRFSYANTEMNNIRAMVRQTSFVNSFQNQTFRSGDGIPGCIGAYLNAYYDIVGSLLNSISLETDSVLSYVQAVLDLDNDLASNVPQGSIVFDSTLEGYIPIGLENYQPKEEKKDDKNKSGSTSGGHTGEYTGGTTPTQTAEESQEKKPDYIYDFDGYQGLIYMDNGKIDSIKYRYTYATEMEATYHLAETKEKYKDIEYIGEVVQTGVYIDALFKEEFIKDKSYEEIVEEYFKGGKIHG